MDTRIQELAEQTIGANPKYAVAMIMASPELEKFAELIVRECIVDFYRRYLDTTSNEDITVQVERYIEQNFGVE